MSVRPGETPTKPERRPWTLRSRLILGVVALLAAASIVIGAVSVVALRGFLLERLDEQLQSATGRSQIAVEGGQGDAPAPQPPDDGSPFLRFGVQGPYTVTAVAIGQDVAAGVVTAEGGIELLSDAQTAELVEVPSSGEPVTVDLGGELGEYRFAAHEVRSGVLLLTGLPMSDVNATVTQLVSVILVVLAVVLIAAAVAGFFVVRLALRPLDRVTATAERVSELPLERGDVALAVRVPEVDSDPRTEVGRVGSSINRMLGHIGNALEARQQSENKVRRFVADASHELRTPLASIRGYAELTRLSGHELPDDVVHSISRVESESVRMTALVEDLLLLARLDEGRDLERGEVDLSMMLIDAVGDAHAAGPDHEWSLDLPEEPVVVQGDRGRLHQVVVNLLANARVHTPAGTAVEAGITEEEKGVVISVVDHGPGIPEEEQAALFERFVRGDSSRSRIAGSTGLGLSIVRAVVEAHHGSVSVSSVPGRTEFRVELPRA